MSSSCRESVFSAPIIILVCPQLAENIGMTARAMANFGLEELRLVTPRDGWPNRKSLAASSGAHWILENAIAYESLEAALHDVNHSFALTARQHGQTKEVLHPKDAMVETNQKTQFGEKVAFIFGRERNGLESEEIALADKIVTFPISKKFSSLNLAQAVMLIAYEFAESVASPLPFQGQNLGKSATKQQLFGFYERLEVSLTASNFFRPPEKAETMKVTLRNIFNKMNATEDELHTLSGVVAALTQAQKAHDSFPQEQSEALRQFLKVETPVDLNNMTPLKGITRMLRRNPSEVELKLWAAIVKNKQLSQLGIKRAIPVGHYILDFASIKNKFVLEILRDENEASRKERHIWLESKGYTILTLTELQINDDISQVINSICTYSLKTKEIKQQGHMIG